MKMPIGNAQAVVSEYVESVLLPAASAVGGMTPFTTGLVGGLIVRQVPRMMEQYAPTLRALGLLDEENRIDVDLLAEEALKAIDRAPVVIAGYRADRSDVEKLKSIMERHGG